MPKILILVLGNFASSPLMMGFDGKPSYLFLERILGIHYRIFRRVESHLIIICSSIDLYIHYFQCLRNFNGLFFWRNLEGKYYR